LADFILPFGDKLSGDNRWIKLAELIPWNELEDYYAAQFCKEFGAPAKPFRMALGALFIKARLNLTDEELVEQIKENPCLQFFIGLEAFEYAAPFDPSMVFSARRSFLEDKRLPESVVNVCDVSGPRLGRPKSDPDLVAEEKRQFIDDQRRSNAFEGKLGQGKRRFGLGLIREKLALTQGSTIAMSILVMNLEKLLELHLVLFTCWLHLLWARGSLSNAHSDLFLAHGVMA